MIAIPLRDKHGEAIAHALVDDVDAEHARHRWTRAGGRGSGSYASRQVDGRTIYLHREILGLQHGDARQGDHVNRDKLDCRRANLRIVTLAQNRQNLAKYRRVAGAMTSAHRGVAYDRKRGQWTVSVKANGRRRQGRFALEQDAADAARRWRGELMSHAVETV